MHTNSWSSMRYIFYFLHSLLSMHVLVFLLYLQCWTEAKKEYISRQLSEQPVTLVMFTARLAIGPLLRCGSAYCRRVSQPVLIRCFPHLFLWHLSHGLPFFLVFDNNYTFEIVLAAFFCIFTQMLLLTIYFDLLPTHYEKNFIRSCHLGLCCFM